MASGRFLTTVNSKLTSRTKEGGRRRRYTLDVVRVGLNASLDYVVPLRAKSVERFLAMEKLTLFDTAKNYRDTKVERELLERDQSIRRNYVPIKRNFSVDTRFKAEDAVFLDKTIRNYIPRRLSFNYKSTKTILGTIPVGQDIVAEPILYSVLKQLGFGNVFVKNFGSRHKSSRVHNLLKILTQIESPIVRQRRLAVSF